MKIRNLTTSPILAAVAAMTLSACGGSDSHRQQEAAREITSDGSTRGRHGQTAAAPGTPVRIRAGDAVLTARLDDNAPAGDLAAQLPLTLTFRDHNSVEKTAPLPRKLSLEGVPAGHDPVAGEIGYWAPDGDLVLYYDDAAPYWDGIVRIGEVEDDLSAVEQLPQAARVTIERVR